jgi:hypothetical protein
MARGSVAPYRTDRLRDGESAGVVDHNSSEWPVRSTSRPGCTTKERVADGDSTTGAGPVNAGSV